MRRRWGDGSRVWDEQFQRRNESGGKEARKNFILLGRKLGKKIHSNVREKFQHSIKQLRCMFQKGVLVAAQCVIEQTNEKREVGRWDRNGIIFLVDNSFIDELEHRFEIVLVNGTG